MTALHDLDGTRLRVAERLLNARTSDGHWVGELASSALSTATAIVALALAKAAADDLERAALGLDWLIEHQNADGGWGDTTRSHSNISTTALCWAAFAVVSPRCARGGSSLARCEAWLSRAAGGLDPDALVAAITRRYGKDHTFSAPILTTLALCGRLGEGGWRYVPQLPFELAACPPQVFQWLQLPVVSYALPALIAIGEVRHHHCPSRNAATRLVRNRLSARVGGVLRRIQPSTGGYLEATPLTSFVVMSLAGMNRAGSDVAREGLRFLRASMRANGSWPVDTNLATWVTTLSINALASGSAGRNPRMTPAPTSGGKSWPECVPEADRERLATWLVEQQHRMRHPYTDAAPGGWAWTPLPGGVPDADDTAGALLALHHLGTGPGDTRAAVVAGVEWLLGLQNRDGGMPTFCRGWGALPFDRSTPDLTAHALRAWHVWRDVLPQPLGARVDRATARALTYLEASQRRDGAWIPLWFGNEHATDETNPTYGTTRVVLALAERGREGRSDMLERAVEWIAHAQNDDGGWGGDRGVGSTLEETSFAVEALAAVNTVPSRPACDEALRRGLGWLAAALERDDELRPAPIGLYFAKLWYFEVLYPLIFATAALSRAAAAPSAEP